MSRGREIMFFRAVVILGRPTAWTQQNRLAEPSCFAKEYIVGSELGSFRAIGR